MIIGAFLLATVWVMLAKAFNFLKFFSWGMRSMVFTFPVGFDSIAEMLLVAVVIAIASSLLPILKIVKQKPVDVIRG